MVVIVDKRTRVRSLFLRERILECGVPCALCSPETLPFVSGAAVTVCFAKNEDEITLASLRAGKTALVAVNLSGRHMFHHDAVIWDRSKHGDLVRFILKTTWERTGKSPHEFCAGNVRITSDGVFFHNRFLRLTDTQRLIMFHLAACPDVFHTEREVRMFACPHGDLRLRRSSVSVHITHINQKAYRAAGEKIITCRRGHGYAVMTSLPQEPKKRVKYGFVPPFS